MLAHDRALDGVIDPDHRSLPVDHPPVSAPRARHARRSRAHSSSPARSRPERPQSRADPVRVVRRGCGSIAVPERGPNHISAAIIVIFCGIAWIGIQNLGYAEFSQARRLILAGGFRQALNSSLELRAFDQALSEAQTREQRWAVLRDALKKFGLVEVHWFVEGKTVPRCALEQQWPGLLEPADSPHGRRLPQLHPRRQHGRRRAQRRRAGHDHSEQTLPASGTSARRIHCTSRPGDPPNLFLHPAGGPESAAQTRLNA